MGREATAALPIRPNTKELVDEVKPEGVTYDHWVKNDPRLPDGDNDG